MKKGRFILCILLVAFFIAFNFTLVCSAASLPKTTEISDERLTVIKSNLKMRKSDDEFKNLPILCFDVNDEFVALGLDTGDTEKIIHVYDDNFKFLYSYKFNTYGTFAVRWCDGELMVWLVRDSLAVYLDAEGSVSHIEYIDDTSENAEYLRNVLQASEREINGVTYKLKSGVSSYSQLIKEDPYGEKVVLYDASLLGIKLYVFEIIALCLIVPSVAIIITMKLKKQRISFWNVAR